jgi:hypothetical protein
MVSPRMAEPPPSPESHELTRFLILRLVGLIYFVAFLVFLRQGLPLIGHDGLTPADMWTREVAQDFGSRASAFWHLPSLFWLGASDASLLAVGWVGLIVSFGVMVGLANVPALVLLWALYMSVVHVGQIWYGYGWENQLLETGFLAVFLCPLGNPLPFPQRAAPPAVFWLFRWLTFRIMLGAGLIKLRGDACWRDFTCLDFHYLTQPIPSPLSRWFHDAPHAFHALGVGFNHLCEVVAPFFLLAPNRVPGARQARHAAGVLLVAFQVLLVLSGNLSFLNWLTVVPILASFDDGFWGRGRGAEGVPSRAHRIATGICVALVAVLSVPAVLNLLSSHQVMNTGHEPFELVNSYGAFGTVGKERNEIIFEGTDDAVVSDATRWLPYEFPCKPGDPNRRPCLISPYHLRLDWQVWFAAMGTPEDEPWFVHFVWKLLHNDPGTLSLLATNPFPERPPRFVRARLFRYDYAPTGGNAWWRRTEVGVWLPPLSVEDPRLLRFLSAYGWAGGGPT